MHILYLFVKNMHFQNAKIPGRNDLPGIAYKGQIKD